MYPELDMHLCLRRTQPFTLPIQSQAQVKSLNMQQLLAKSRGKDPLNVAKSGLLTKQPTGSWPS